jgi:hypothetical protein
MKAIHHYVEQHKRLAVVSRRSEALIHATYCSVLFIEGHGTYAIIGGVLGLVVLFNFLIEG